MHLIWAFFRRYFVFFSVLLAGLLVIAGTLLLIQKQIQAAAQNRLEMIGAVQAAQLEARLVQQQEVLLGLQAALTLNPKLDRQQFYNLLLQSNVMYRHPSLLAVALARPVAHTDLPQYLAAVRADKRVAPLPYKNFTAKPVVGDSPLLVLEHLYPINRLTEQFLGSNLAESDDLKEGMGIARDTGRMLASPVIRLDQHDEPVFCLFAPIYVNLPVEPTVVERRTHHVGTVLVYVRLNEILRPISRVLEEHDLSWQLFDQGYALQTWLKARAASEVMRSATTVGAAASQSMTQLVHLPGRQWRIDLHSLLPVWSEKENEWLIMVAVIATLSLILVAALMQFLYLSRQWSLQMLMKAQGDEQLRQQQSQLLMQAVQNSRDALVLRQPDGKIIYANAMAQQWFAPDEHDLLGKYDVLLSQSELGDLTHSSTFSLHYPPGDSEGRQLDVAVQPVRNEILQPVAIAMQVRDVSESYAQYLELRASNQRLSEMVELSSDWFWEQDTEARFTLVTGGFFSRFDVSPSFFIGKRRWDLGSGGLSQAQWDEHRAILAKQLPYRDFEYSSTLGRETIIVSVSGFPCFNAEGQFTGYRGIGRDVTAVRMAQKALLSEQQRAQATLESIADGVITTDIYGRVDYINPVASSLVGWELASAKGQLLSVIYQSVDRLSRLPLPDLVDEVLREGGQYHGTRRSVLLNKFGLNFQVEESAARIRDEQTRTIGAVLVFRDISNWRDLDDRVELMIN
ncbi:PAS domain S-box protein [Chitinibacter sp. FCG-7]|uniref:PAS domain S-box protein n=1 Tax=Chitinibacter mangrovi TaxID=3153927 RepID=A0AAU7FDF2_9NEIS